MYETWSWHTYSYAFSFVLKTGCDTRSPPSYPIFAHILALSTWSGGLSYRKGTVSSKLLDLSPPFCAITLVRQAWASEGHGILQATRPQPTFLLHQLGRAGSGIGWARNPPSYLTSANLFVPSTPTNYHSRKVGPSIPPMKKRGGSPKAPRRIARSLWLSLKKSHSLDFNWKS
jgi:hypothetical protein